MWSGDAEHRDDSFLGEADLGDEGFNGGFAFTGGAAGEDAGEVGLEALDHAGRRAGGLGAEGVFEFGRAHGELGYLHAERGEALAGGFFGHGAVLERGAVAVDGGLLLFDLGEQCGVFGLGVGVTVAVEFDGAGDGVVNQGGVVGVEVREGCEDGGVEGLGWQAGGLAAVGAVAGAGEAGVVAVDAVAAGGGGADVLVAAGGAGDQAGELVVAVAHGALPGGLGAGSGDSAGSVPGLWVDERLVAVLGVDVAVGDVAGVGGVGDDPVDRVPRPRLARPVRHPPLVQLVRDGAGAEALGGEQAEDLPQVWRLLRVRDEPLGAGVDVVAVGA